MRVAAGTLIAMLVLGLLGGATAEANPPRAGRQPGAMRTMAAARLARMRERHQARHPQPVGRIGLTRETVPAEVIHVHQLAQELAPEFTRALGDRFATRVARSSHGYQGPRTGYDVSSVWLRDYHPHFTRDANGELEAVTFLSINPVRSGYFGADWLPIPPPRPGAQAFRLAAGDRRWLATRTVPLIHEHGNLVSTGDWAIVTDKLAADNARPVPDQPHLTRAGYLPRGRDEVHRMLAEALRIDANRIVSLPTMPGERTGHVDTYVLALGTNEVMVPEIRTAQLDRLDYGHERELGHRVRGFLDAQAERLAALGMTVHRLPMLAPVYLAHEHGEWKGNFYTPANSLVVNAAGKRVAFVPAFDPAGFPEHYRATNQQYQSEWTRFFRERGYEPVVVDATRLGRANGLLRCLTAITPE